MAEPFVNVAALELLFAPHEEDMVLLAASMGEDLELRQ